MLGIVRLGWKLNLPMSERGWRCLLLLCSCRRSCPPSSIRCRSRHRTCMEVSNQHGHISPLFKQDFNMYGVHLLNGEMFGVRANYVARIRGSQWLDCFRCFRCAFAVMARYAKSCSGATDAMMGFSSCAILRWEIPDPSMIYVLETSERKTHQIDCPQHMSLAQTGISFFGARTTTTDISSKNIKIDLPRQRSSPEKDKLFGSSKDTFLVPGTLRC